MTCDVALLPGVGFVFCLSVVLAQPPAPSAIAPSAPALSARAPSVRAMEKGDYHFFVNGEPKSGTTWIEFLVRSMLYHFCLSEPKCTYSERPGRHHVMSVREWKIDVGYDLKHMIPYFKHENSFDFSEPAPVSDADIDAASTMASKQKAHGGGHWFGWLPILRDPRAVLVSTCYHKGLHDCDKFAMEFISATAGFTDIRHRFFQSAIEKSKGTLARMTFYERLKADFVNEVRDLSMFIFGSPLSDAQIELVRQNTSFSSMKKQEAEGLVPKGGASVTKVRKGTSCGFEKDLRNETLACITDVMRHRLSPTLNSLWRCDFEDDLPALAFSRARRGKRRFTLSGGTLSGVDWLKAVVDIMLRQTCSEDTCCELRNAKSEVIFASPSGWIRSAQDLPFNPFFVPNVALSLDEEQVDSPQLSSAMIDEMAAQAIKNPGRTNAFFDGLWVAVLRDPRDVLVSLCQRKAIPDCDAFAKEHISSVAGWTDLRYRFFQSVFEQSKGKSARVVFYEALQNNFTDEVLRLSDFFFEAPLPSAVISTIQHEAQERFPMTNETACSFRQKLLEETSAHITDVMRDKMAPALSQVWRC